MLEHAGETKVTHADLPSSHTVRSDEMDFILPGNDNRIVATPFYRPRGNPRLRIVFAVLALEITAHHPDLAFGCEKRYKPSRWGNARMFERPILKDFILGLRWIYHINSLVNSQQYLHRAR